jgi:hypothetical protein
MSSQNGNRAWPNLQGVSDPKFHLEGERKVADFIPV